MRRVVAIALLVTACAAPAPTATAAPPTPAVVVAAPAAPTPMPTATPVMPASLVAPSRLPTTPIPRAVLDARTAALVELLDAWCPTSPAGPPSSVPFDVIGQLASGRSAHETAEVLMRAKCLLQAFAYGSGDSEVVTVGAYRATGALLWVDRGFWRIAPIPIDYGFVSLLWDRHIGSERELFLTRWSGGSAGACGFVAIGITGAAARMTLHAGGGCQMSARRIDDEHVLVTGRTPQGRRWGIDSNCCVPGGHEWLWRWAASGYTLVGERQARDPYYALNALLGAIDDGRPDSAADVATRPTIAAATALFGPGRLWTYKASTNASDEQRAELLRWSVLPGIPPAAPTTVRYEVARYDPAGPSAVITFERIGDGWIATDARAGTLP